MQKLQTVNHNGFTLIELMITLAIIGVISSIAFAAYSNYVGAALEVEGWNNLNALQIAEEEYSGENQGVYFGTTTATTTTAATEAASGGLWAATPNTEAARNFTYTVILIGTTGYTIKASGKGGTSKVPTSVVLTITK